MTELEPGSAKGQDRKLENRDRALTVKRARLENVQAELKLEGGKLEIARIQPPLRRAT